MGISGPRIAITALLCGVLLCRDDRQTYFVLFLVVAETNLIDWAQRSYGAAMDALRP